MTLHASNLHIVHISNRRRISRNHKTRLSYIFWQGNGMEFFYLRSCVLKSSVSNHKYSKNDKSSYKIKLKYIYLLIAGEYVLKSSFEGVLNDICWSNKKLIMV